MSNLVSSSHIFCAGIPAFVPRQLSVSRFLVDTKKLGSACVVLAQLLVVMLVPLQRCCPWAAQR